MIIPYYMEFDNKEHQIVVEMALYKVVAFYVGQPVEDKTLEELECRLENK